MNENDDARERALRDLDRKEWRNLGYALALLVVLGVVGAAAANGLVPAVVVGPIAVVALVGFTMLRFKGLDAQVERGRLDPMTLGERSWLLAVALAALVGIVLVRAQNLAARVEVPFYVGACVVLLGTVAIVNRRHKRRRRGTG